MRLWLFFALLCLAGGCATAPRELDSSDVVPELQKKLADQWKRYDEARALTLGKNGEATREEWETALTVSPPFTEAELSALRAVQDARVAAQRAAGVKASVLDLDALRKRPRATVALFCAELPKGGMLHVHPWGTVSEPAIARMFEKLDPTIKPAEILSRISDPWGKLYPAERNFLKGLGRRYGGSFHYSAMSAADRKGLHALFFLKEGVHPFDRFEAVFTLMMILLDPAGPTDAMMYDDFLSRAKAERVSYVELARLIYPVEGAHFAPLDDWADEMQRRYGVTVRMQEAFLGALFTREKNRANALALLSLPPYRATIGINHVNNESGIPFFERAQGIYAPILKAVLDGKSRLHIDAHAGEFGDVRNVRDALILGAERIGHGVNLRKDPVTMEYARLHAVPIETNLTSNLRLGGVKSLREHPFLYFARLGMKVSLSTDDEGIFVTDMNHECEAAVRETDISYAELRAMLFNSLDTSFAPAETIDPIRDRLASELKTFEAAWRDRGL
jgi:hypothetical protein